MIYKKNRRYGGFFIWPCGAMDPRLHGGGDGVVCVNDLGPGVKPQDDNFF